MKSKISKCFVWVIKLRDCLKSGRIYQKNKKIYKIWHEISTRLVESRAIFIRKKEF